MVVVDAPHVLVGMALGSCVGLMMLDARVGVAGFAHVMLPATADPGTATPGKYADTAVVAMTDALLALGGRRGLIVAKLAGGAQMFSVSDDQMAIGDRNVEALISLLKSGHVPLVGRETGGSAARTVEFDTKSGVAKIRMAHGRELRI